MDNRGILSPVPRHKRPAGWNRGAFALGRALAGAREQSGLSVRELSHCAGIPLRFLSYLEDGRIDLIPVAHARGYVRTYASAVGLNADDATLAMCQFERRARFINRELAKLIRP